VAAEAEAEEEEEEAGVLDLLMALHETGLEGHCNLAQGLAARGDGATLPPLRREVPSTRADLLP